jgi:hypothetical protein
MQPEPAAPPPSAQPIDTLASILRGAMKSYAELDRRARQRLGSEHSLLQLVPALLARGGLGAGLRGVAEVQALRELASLSTGISLSSPNGGVDTIFLASKQARTIPLYRTPLEDEHGALVPPFLEPLVSVAVNDPAPQIHLDLAYRWAPNSGYEATVPVVIELYWASLDDITVSSDVLGTPWSRSSFMSDQTPSERIGRIFTSEQMYPNEGYVKTTLKLDGRAQYEIWLRTNQEANVPADKSKPKAVTDPVPEPTAGIDDGFLAALDPAGVQEFIRGLDDLLHELTKSYRVAAGSSMAVFRNAAAMADLRARLVVRPLG